MPAIEDTIATFFALVRLELLICLHLPGLLMLFLHLLVFVQNIYFPLSNSVSDFLIYSFKDNSPIISSGNFSSEKSITASSFEDNKIKVSI